MASFKHNLHKRLVIKRANLAVAMALSKQWGDCEYPRLSVRTYLALCNRYDNLDAKYTKAFRPIERSGGNKWRTSTLEGRIRVLKMPWALTDIHIGMPKIPITPPLPTMLFKPELHAKLAESCHVSVGRGFVHPNTFMLNADRFLMEMDIPKPTLGVAASAVAKEAGQSLSNAFARLMERMRPDILEYGSFEPLFHGPDVVAYNIVSPKGEGTCTIPDPKALTRDDYIQRMMDLAKDIPIGFKITGDVGPDFGNRLVQTLGRVKSGRSVIEERAMGRPLNKVDITWPDGVADAFSAEQLTQGQTKLPFGLVPAPSGFKPLTPEALLEAAAKFKKAVQTSMESLENLNSTGDETKS